MTLKKRAAKGVAWTLAERLFGWGIMFLVLIVLARLLTPADFGVVALAGMFVYLPQFLLYEGFASAVIQKNDLRDDYLDTAFWIILGVSTTIATGLLALAPLMAIAFNEPKLASVIMWLSPVVAINGMMICHDSLFRRALDFKPLAIRTILSSLAGGLTGIAMAYAGMGIYSLVGQQLVTATVMALVLWQSSRWRPRFNCHAGMLASCFGSVPACSPLVSYASLPMESAFRFLPTT